MSFLKITVFVTALLAVSAAPGRADFDADEKNAACEVVKRVTAGTISYGQLSVDERMSYDYLKAQDPVRFSTCSGEAAKPVKSAAAYRPAMVLDQPLTGKISYVADATVVVLNTGQKVVLFGIHVPEEKKQEAVRFLKSRAVGQTVDLRYDTVAKDKYGKLQAYVFVGNKALNRLLIEEDFAEINESGAAGRLKGLLTGQSSQIPNAGGYDALDEQYAAEIQVQNRYTLMALVGGIGGITVLGILMRRKMK